MTEGSLDVNIVRVDGQGMSRTRDRVASEEPLEIQLCSSTAAGAAAKSLSITMRTPGDDRALALGFLLTEGIIGHADDVIDVAHHGPVDAANGLQNSIRVELQPQIKIDFEKLQRHFYTTSSCGVCGKASLDALRVAGQHSLEQQQTVFRVNTITAMPDRVREMQPLFAATGGLHAAAIFDSDGEILVVKEDVGRHNATDKAIGSLLSDGKLPGHHYGLLVSGRASFELMQKALVAGIPLLAAVGAPSSLAVGSAQEFAMTLIGFLRDGSFNIYAGEARIEQGDKQNNAHEV